MGNQNRERCEQETKPWEFTYCKIKLPRKCLARIDRKPDLRYERVNEYINTARKQWRTTSCVICHGLQTHQQIPGEVRTKGKTEVIRPESRRIKPTQRQTSEHWRIIIMRSRGICPAPAWNE